jgi:hypothetical protein
MAEKAGHIVIWFDPWEHSNKAALWQAFKTCSNGIIAPAGIY